MKLLIHKKKVDADICKGLAVFLGFMFSLSQGRAKVLVFPSERKISLHMLFVFFPLNILLLDSQKRIIETTKLGPFSFFSSKKKARYVIEIPSSLFTKLRLRVKKGEKIKFIS